jgi:hypothetical protein
MIYKVLIQDQQVTEQKTYQNDRFSRPGSYQSVLLKLTSPGITSPAQSAAGELSRTRK